MLKRWSPADLDPDKRLVHWYLCFTEASGPSWWDRFLRLGFEHVYAFRQVGAQWVTVNPRTDYLEIALEDGLVHNLRSTYAVPADKEVTVLSVLAEVPKRKLRSRWFTGPVTCVEIVKALLGIRTFWIFTPWQLYNYVRQCRGTIRQAQNTRTVSY